MAFFDSIGRGLGFSSSNAGGRAAEKIEEANRKAIDFLKEQFGLSEEQLAPFLETGLEGFERFADASTPEGFDDLIGRISGTDTFGNLLNLRKRGVESALATGGLSRSGAAVEELSQLPVDIALQIEQAVTGRSGSLGDIGFSTATNLSGLRQNLGSQVGGLEQEIGRALAGGIITDAQAQAAADENLLRTLGGGVRGAIIGGGDPSGLIKAVSTGAFF